MQVDGSGIQETSERKRRLLSCTIMAGVIMLTGGVVWFALRLALPDQHVTTQPNAHTPSAVVPPSADDFVGRWEDDEGFISLDVQNSGKAFVVLYLEGGHEGHFQAGGTEWRADGSRIYFWGAVAGGTGAMSTDKKTISASVKGVSSSLKNLRLRRTIVQPD